MNDANFDRSGPSSTYREKQRRAEKHCVLHPPQEGEIPHTMTTPGRIRTLVEAEPRQHPDCAVGARHAERLLLPRRDAEQKMENRMCKRTYRADAGRARILQ